MSAGDVTEQSLVCAGSVDATEPRVRRSLVFYGLGMLLGLTVAGVQLFTGRGAETRTIPAEDVAVVNGQSILRADFITQTESETGRPFDHTSRQERLRVLEEMVQEELKVQRGLELNFAESDQDARNALVAVMDQEMIAEVAASEPTDQTLEAYYQSHRAHYSSPGEMTVCDLLVAPVSGASDEAARAEQAHRANEAVSALRGGMALDQVLKRYQLVEKNGCENNFYFAIQLHLGAALYRLAESLPSEAVSEPLATADGWHVLKMLRNSPPVPQSYAEAFDQVRNDYRSEREASMRARTIEFLRRRARIQIASDYAEHPTP